MYTPVSFKLSDLNEIHGFMREYGFATLVTHGPGGLTATHLPILLDSQPGEYGALYGHMARSNPQWQNCIDEVLVVFAGPHAYISPTWYEATGTVPTWNYVAIHAYGKLQLIEEPEALHDLLSRLVDTYEQAMPRPWSYAQNDSQISHMLPAIVGFRIEIERLEGKAKLSQNHPEERRERVIQALQGQANDNAQAIAQLMSKAR